MAEIIQIYARFISKLNGKPVSDFRVDILGNGKAAGTEYVLNNGTVTKVLKERYDNIRFIIFKGQNEIQRFDVPFVEVNDPANIKQFDVNADPFTSGEGPQGISITNSKINGSGNLIITLSDGRTIDAGKAKGEPGATGSQGISITNSKINSSGNLIITLSNGTTIDAGKAKGEPGATGPKGPKGNSIERANVDAAGNLSIKIEGQTEQQIGNIKGIQGDRGPVGPQGPAFSDRNAPTNLSIGWHRFATGPGNRHFNTFYLTDQTPYNHHSLTLSAGIHYGDNPTLNVIGQSWEGNGSFKKLRIVKKGVHDPVYVEVYIDGKRAVNNNCQAMKLTSLEGSDWQLHNFTPGSIPTGYSTLELDISQGRGLNTSHDINTNQGYKVKGQPIVDQDGKWVGDPTNLRGADGKDGNQGIEGIGITGARLEGRTLVLTRNRGGDLRIDNVKGLDGNEGAVGVSITNSKINSSGNLIITLSDGRTIDAGKAKGELGATGPKGPKGNSIELANVDDAGNLSIKIEGQTEQQIGNIKGVQGDRGPVGPAFSDRNSPTNLSIGWHRFATGPGTRHFNTFYLTDQTPYNHHSLTLSAGIHYGDNPTLNVIGQSWEGNGSFKKLRIVKKGVHDPVYVEVYIDGKRAVNNNCQAMKLTSLEGSDWQLHNFTPGSIPTGYSTLELDISQGRGLNTSHDINTNQGYKVKGTPIIDQEGNWVGNPTNLKGTDGRNAYFHVAYAASSDGRSEFSTSPTLSSTHIGIYSGETAIANINDHTLYSWSLFKGTDGNNGRGIESIELQPSGFLQITYTDQTTTEIDLTTFNMIPPKEYIIKGIVANANGLPLKNHTVQAYHRSNNSDTEIGSSVQTIDSGEYIISLHESDLKNLKIKQLDLVVKVFNGSKEVIASPLIIDAKTEETINLADTDGEFKGLVEYKFFDGRLRSKLNSLNTEDLNKSAVLNDLAKETNSTLEEIGQFIQVEKAAESIGIDKELTYGLTKNGNLNSLADLMTMSKSEVKATIQAGVDAGKIDANIASETQIDTYVNSLRTKAIVTILDQNQGVNEELNNFMTTANLTSNTQKEAFLNLYLEFGADSDTFWTEVEKNAVLGASKADLKNRTDLIALTDEPILAKNLIDGGKTAASLVGITETELKTTLNASTINWDDRFEGETQTDKVTSYAKTLLKRIENGNPTGVFSSRIKTAGDDKSNRMNLFLSGNPDFKFEGNSINKYLSDNPESINRILIKESEKTELIEDLEAMQRLFKVGPANFKYEAAKPMFDNGLKSATDIYSMGKANFLESNFFGDRTVSEEVFLQAEQQAAVLMHLFAENSQKVNALVPQVIKSIGFATSDSIDGLPDLESLFGSQDVCACKHCRSVYSPAAYLVDLLNWIKNAKSTNNASYDNLKAILDSRRPELEHILLTCENTNTPMPYIDLVNEVLEYAIAAEFTTGVTNASDYLNRQTTYPATYLKAHPEHLNVKVYEFIKNSVYPFSAPFDLFDAESKIYFEHLGINHATLLEKFNSTATVGDIAGIELGLNPLEKAIITGSSNHTFAQFFNNQTLTALQESLRRVIDTTGLSFEELQAYLEVNYVTKALSADPAISFEDECNVNSATINFREKEFTRMMQFERLKHALGWNNGELDGLLSGFIPGNTAEIDDATLTKISLVQTLAKKYDLEPLEVLAWFTNLPNHSYNEEESYFIKTFINKSVNDPSESVITSLSGITPVTNSTISQVFDPSATGFQTEKIFAEGVLPIVLAATRLTEEELRLIIPSTAHNTIETTVSNLSYCFRMASLKDALGTSMEDLYSYLAVYPSIKVTATDTFSINTTATKDFIAFVEQMQELSINGDDLNYILGSNAKEALYFDAAYWESTLLEIQTALINFKDNFFRKDKGIRDWVINILERFQTLQQVGFTPYTKEEALEFIKIFDGTSSLSTVEDDQDNTQQLFIVNKVIKSLFYTYSDDLNIRTAPNEISIRQYAFDYLIDSNSSDYIEPNSEENIKARYTGLFEDPAIAGFFHNLLDGAKANLIKEILGKAYPNILEGDILYQRFHSMFTDNSFISTSPSMLFTMFSQFLKLFERAYFLFEKLHVLPEETKDFLEPFSQFDIHTPTASSNVAAFIKTAAIAVENKQHRKENLSLFSILGKARIDSTYRSSGLKKDLQELKGWNELSTLLDGSFMGTIDYNNYNWYFDVKAVAETLWKAELKPDMLKQVTGSTALNADKALILSNACKSKYGNEKWSEIAVEFREVLRKKQRDALANFIQYNSAKNFKDRFELYEHFLIDTEMDPCRMTSRIKQANSTIQLFVQRILLNLEQPAVLSEGNANEWEWRKNYRVWEANRKVFLYPENWIEPELRDDQTPFFKEFMDEIMQSGITNENAIDAYHNYLTKLDMVAELEVMQHFYDKEKDELHVVARGNTQPHIHYYRKWVDRSSWTPWEKIDLDIESSHLAPVVYQSRLILFWFEHTWEPIPDEVLTEGQAASKVATTYLNWSEYKNGKWQKRSRFKEGLSTFTYSNKYSGFEDLAYKVSVNDSSLSFHCYRTTNGSNTNVYLQYNRESYGSFSITSINKSPVVINNGSKSTISGLYHGEFYGFTQNDNGELIVKHEGPEIKNSKTNEITLLKSTRKETRSYVVVSSQNRLNQHIYADDPFFYRDSVNSYFIAKKPLFNTFTTTVRKYIDSSLLASIPILPMSTQFSYEKKELNGPLDKPFYSKSSKVSTSKDGQDVYVDNTGYYVLETKTIQASKPYKHKFQFFPFDHKQVGSIVNTINKYGIDGLFKPMDTGQTNRYRVQFPEITSSFEENYIPDSKYVYNQYPVDDVDFSASGSYSMYNWELFFHIPMMVATELTNNQQFEDAQKWFHFIFDPTQVVTDETAGKEDTRYWNTRPFKTFNGETSIQKLMKQLNEQNEEMEKQVAIWRKDPFNPYAIARLRWVAFMKNVVMKYLDMLIAWGDYLFRRDSIESVNEATQVYILAAQILGRRPEKITRKDLSPRSFATLGGLDSFSNTLIAMENALPIRLEAQSRNLFYRVNKPNSVTVKEVLFFCIPENSKLVEYWDTVADRLFKIRHCQNIEGIVRQLPLFEPPIDPAMLVRARANGLSISQALANLNAPMSFYRYGYLYQKAVEVTNDVKALGSALLAAIEKQDAEEIALLRTSHEKQVLKAVKQVRKQAIKEAEKSIEALLKTKEITEERRAFYAGRKKTSAREKQQIRKMNTAFGLSTTSQSLSLIAKAVTPIPAIATSVGLNAGVTTEIVDGQKLAQVLEFASQGINISASSENHMASIIGMRAGHDLRYEDWQFQTKQAAKELEQLAIQIQSAEIRQAMAQAELDNHILQMENNDEIGSIMKDKFSNKKLYSWMVKEISSIYFKAYQLAFDLAKKAEKAYKFDVGYEDDKQYIQFGSWDNLKKGLLSGDRLLQDLRTLDSAFTNKNKRLNELTKQVSLAMVNPVALQELRSEGKCVFELPELLFDLDHPGHYMRRIKAVTVSIPAVASPYTGVTGSLTLLANRFRKNTKLLNNNTDYAYDISGDERFHYFNGGTERIATSSGVNDSGMFEMNFNEARFLPFEGSGVISRWRFELPFEGTNTAFRKFDYNTISDLIITLHYTSKDGGDGFKDKVETHVNTSINHWLNEASETETGLNRVFSMRHEFPTAFHQFLNPASDTANHETKLVISDRHFPHVLNGISKNTGQIMLLVKLKKGYAANASFSHTAFTLQRADDPNSTFTNFQNSGNPVAVGSDTNFGDQPTETFTNSGTINASGTWKLIGNTGSSDLGGLTPSTGSSPVDSNHQLVAGAIEDILFVMNYKKA